MATTDQHENSVSSKKPVTSQRLVVELGRRATTDLAWLVDEEEINKTTVVNRALQVYRIIKETERNGGQVKISDPVRGEAILHIVS